MRLLRLAGITGAAFALSLVAGGALTPAQTATGAERVLPDLVQILPGKVGIAHRSSARGTRTLLTFDSSAENHGTGPLIIRGSRPDRTTTTMRADQLIRHTDDSLDRVRGVGALSFYRSRDHRHWHLARFMSYELR